MRLLRKGGIYRSDSSPGPSKRTRREDHALLIVRDEFRAGYSLIGLFASRARLHFTGARRLTCSLQRHRLKATFDFALTTRPGFLACGTYFRYNSATLKFGFPRKEFLS